MIKEFKKIVKEMEEKDQFSEGMWKTLMSLIQSNEDKTIADVIRELDKQNIELKDGYKFGFGK